MPEAPWLFGEGLFVDAAVDMAEFEAVVGSNFGAELGAELVAELGAKVMLGQG